MYKLDLTISLGCITSTGLKNGVYGYDLYPDFEEKVKAIKNSSIKGIELGFSGSLYAPLALKLLKKAVRIVKKHKVKINTIHFPYANWVDLACPWPTDRVEIIKWIGKVFKTLNKLNPNAYIFHPGGEFATEAKRDEFMGYVVDSCEQLAKLTKVPICMENMVGGCLTNTIDRICEFAEKAPNCYVVLDTNHLRGEERPEDAIYRLKDRIKALHISDTHFIYEEHKMPGEGLIDWQKVIKALEDVGYKGSFNYELKAGYTCKQIEENYEKLFEEYNKNK